MSSEDGLCPLCSTMSNVLSNVVVDHRFLSHRLKILRVWVINARKFIETTHIKILIACISDQTTSTSWLIARDWPVGVSCAASTQTRL